MMDTEAIYSAVCAYGAAKCGGDAFDAHDSIEEVKSLLNEAEAEHKSLLADNERLVDEVAELKAAYESQFKELHTLKTENERLVDEVAEARKETGEQARLNGMGAEREARLMAEVSELKAKLTDNSKLPPLPEPDHFAFHDFGQGIWIEGGPTGTPFYSEQQVQELMREAVRLNAQAVPNIEDMKDRLVAISSAVADSDHREAQAIIGTTLKLISAAPAAQGEVLRSFADRLERLAFAIPAPNVHTPQLVELAIAMRAAAVAAQAPRPCTCHPDDRPDGPCREKYASNKCLAAAVDARDAARYRWLRKGANDEVAVVRGLGAMDYGMSGVAYTYSEEIDGDDLDAAIDASMKEQGHA